MGRKILAIVSALITAWGIILVGKMFSTEGGFTTPANLEYMNRAEVAAYFSSQPTSTYVGLLIASVIGALFGGYIVTNMSRRESPGLSLTLVVAVFLIIGGIANFYFLLPGQPLWLVISTLVMYIPVTLLGHWMALALTGINPVRARN